jgi:4a-hydroxytetrahydrobiopterin dehydratase
MKIFSDAKVVSFLGLHLRKWSMDGVSIHRDFTFRNFVEAFAFMTLIAFESEKMNHHPEWNNVYNKVSIHLSTHQPKGITQMDLDLALKIDNHYANFIRSVDQ